MYKLQNVILTPCNNHVTVLNFSRGCIRDVMNLRHVMDLQRSCKKMLHSSITFTSH